jgi:maltose phosphorylase
MEDRKEMMQLVYRIQSVNYDGPITVLALLSRGEDADKWYTLMNHVNDDSCWQWSHLPSMNLQVCCAMNYRLTKNGTLLDKRPIKIEKQDVIGFSLTQAIKTGDVLELTKNVIVQDSLANSQDSLMDNTLSCLTNL